MPVQQLPGPWDFVFQDADDQLFMPTVQDDVAFGPSHQALPPQAVETRVRAALEEGVVRLIGAVTQVDHQPCLPLLPGAGQIDRRVDSSFARVHATPAAQARGRHLLVLMPVKDWPPAPAAHPEPKRSGKGRPSASSAAPASSGVKP